MRIDSQQLAAAVTRLRAGGVVAFPTETVYGLGADAFNAEAVGRVFRLKGRPARNPLIVHVADEAMARRVAAAWPERARRLAAAFWPGPLTLVVARSERVPAVVTGGGTTVAIRMPDHPVALELLRAFGGPLVGPSANPSGGLSPTTAAHVREGFGADGVMVLDGGPCRAGIESTVLTLATDPPTILRPGVIGPARIERVIGTAVAGASRFVGSGPAPGPGMLGRHYAPRAPASIVSAAELRSRLADGGRGRCACLCITGPEGMDERHTAIRMPADAHGYAARLYGALRDADGSGADEILIEAPPRGAADPDESAVWAAVWDRLRRATAADDA